MYVTGLALLTGQNAHVNEPFDSALESTPLDVLPHAWKNIETIQNKCRLTCVTVFPTTSRDLENKRVKYLNNFILRFFFNIYGA